MNRPSKGTLQAECRITEVLWWKFYDMTCCRCNRTGSCKNCSCKKEGRKCDNCLPGKLNKCLNLSSLPMTATTQATSVTTNSNTSTDIDASNSEISSVPTSSNNVQETATDLMLQLISHATISFREPTLVKTCSTTSTQLMKK